MPAYAFRAAEPQESREELERQLTQEVRACKEVRSEARNYVKNFLMKCGVWKLSEIDYPLRLVFEDYVKRYKLLKTTPLTCLHTFDRMKIHAIQEEMQTVAGRRKYEFKYVDKMMFLPYDTRIEIAVQLAKSNDKDGLVWDFTQPCSRELKEQFFKCLNYIVTTYRSHERKEKLRALQYFYSYCIQMGIADLELITLEQERKFVDYLPPEISGRRFERMPGIIELCRKTLFLQANQIHWHAQVWYLERFHFSRERVNPSKKVESISFREISQEENKKYLKNYMQYALGISDMSLSSIQTKFLEIRNLLQTFDEEDKNICEMPEEEIQSYLERLSEKAVAEKTFNLNYSRNNRLNC